MDDAITYCLSHCERTNFFLFLNLLHICYDLPGISELITHRNLCPFEPLTANSDKLFPHRNHDENKKEISFFDKHP